MNRAIVAVASFHSGDPDQVVPAVLYTLILHVSTSARRSLLRQFRQCKNFSCYFATTSAHRFLLGQFRQREDFSSYFTVCSPSAKILVFSLSVFAQISL
jgi:hypothetical protein